MSYRQGSDGAYSRGHQKNLSSFGGGFSVLPPLSIPDTMVLHGRFVRRAVCAGMPLSLSADLLANSFNKDSSTRPSSRP